MTLFARFDRFARSAGMAELFENASDFTGERCLRRAATKNCHETVLAQAR
jgi:hypothetical protein